MTKLINQDCLNYMKTLKDNSVDLIFTDPPYALGSEIIIKSDGKPDYKQARDFMNKWDMPTGEFWEEWYKEAYRVLKHGGHCLMFGMDRQLLLFKYYGHTAGFTEKQSLYWYFISNFPKASDLSKNIAKRKGLMGVQGQGFSTAGDDGRESELKQNKTFRSDYGYKYTPPNHPLAKKYNGLKYSIAPLKQTNETIMVFQKPYKHKSCLNDVLAYEEGDGDVTVGAVNIEGCRVGTETVTINGGGKKWRANGAYTEEVSPINQEKTGRYPAQTYIDSGASEVIDKQSGFSKGSRQIKSKAGNDDSGIGLTGFTIKYDKIGGYNDSGGASRILHKCDYEKGDYDIYHYCAKVSKRERNEGLEGFEERSARTSTVLSRGYCKNCQVVYENCKCGNLKIEYKLNDKKGGKNTHPTVKPIKLLSNILKLFKTPNKQVILDPFMGSGSMGISAIQEGYDYIGVELSEEYYKIAEARINHAQNEIDKRLL